MAGQRRKEALRGSELAREQPSGSEVDDPSDVHLDKFGAAAAANAAAAEMASGSSQRGQPGASSSLEESDQGESSNQTMVSSCGHTSAAAVILVLMVLTQQQLSTTCSLPPQHLPSKPFRCSAHGVSLCPPRMLHSREASRAILSFPDGSC